ncbi:MAG: Fe-S cluster assembly ATPase SufC [Nitrospinae bacterium]|nr:Fe-S cluster assembly ATPase SufC [Nitrospinota bacterium]
MLEIKGLKAGFNGSDILNGISLTVKAGEIHSIMGPNGSGKSTLAKVIAGHPSYHVTSGSAFYEGKDLFAMEPEERALEGIFMSWQNPVEIPGLPNAEFLRMAFNARRARLGEEELDPLDFAGQMDEKMAALGIDEKFRERGVNDGFSGGEKKKNEILQMALLNPRLVILDELDSGLDIDALKMAATGVNTLKGPDTALVVITHYQRILTLIRPDFVHILGEGRIVASGGMELVARLEAEGYEGILAGAGVAP